MVNGVGGLGQQLGRGLQFLQGARQIEAQDVQNQLAAQQLAAQQQQQAQLSGLQRQVVAGQQPVQPLGGQGPRLPVEQQQAQGAQALARLSIQFPDQFEQINQNLGLITQQQKDQAADFAFDLENTPFEQRASKIQQRARTLEAEGRNASDTLSLLELPVDQQNQALQAAQVAALSPGDRVKLAKGEGVARFQKGSTLRVTTPEGPAVATPVFNPATGTTELSVQRFGEGVEPVSELGETVSQQEERKRREAEEQASAKARGKGISERQQLFIDTGVQAADATAITRRGLQLLDEVKTGGVDAAKLRAKQIFGIEGADEAELSTNLGKAVLSQLRATFGAAFTAKEGEQLQRIEAGFGKSTEGNKRLLQQALKISDRAARRGIKAAKDAGDDFTASEIEEALKFDIGEQDEQQLVQEFDFDPATGQLVPR